MEVTLTSTIIEPETEAIPGYLRPRHAPSAAQSHSRSDRRAGLKIIDITEFYSERGGGIRSHPTNRRHFLSEHHHNHLVIAPGPRDEASSVGVESATPGAGKSHLVRLAGPVLPYDPTYHLLHRVDKIRRRVRAERPDVLEAHSSYLATAAVVACGREAARLTTAFWHSDHLGVYVQPALTRWVGGAVARSVSAPLWRGGRA